MDQRVVLAAFARRGLTARPNALEALQRQLRNEAAAPAEALALILDEAAALLQRRGASRAARAWGAEWRGGRGLGGGGERGCARRSQRRGIAGARGRARARGSLRAHTGRARARGARASSSR